MENKDNYFFRKIKKLKNSLFVQKFFRKDLNLNGKWWHRLIKVVFILLLIWLPLYNVFYGMREMKNHYWMEYIDTIDNRIINDDIVQLRSLLNYNEHIELYVKWNDRDWPKIWSLTQYYIDYYDESNSDKILKSMFCAKKWDETKLNKIANETNLWYRSRSDNRVWRPSLKQVNDEIKEYKCVLVDKLNWEKILNHQFEKLDELYIVKRTVKARVRAFLWWCWFYILFQAIILIPWCILIIIYYKIIVYIIYWSYKKDGQK